MVQFRRYFRIDLVFMFSLCAWGMISPGFVQADETRLTVVMAVWTNSVEARNYGAVFSNKAPVAPLYLWMKVKGTEWALQRLQEAGKLPIYHRWFRYSVMGASSEGVTEMIDNIKIPAGSRNLADKLETEITHRGFFDWTTWSMKENIRRGRWVVKVVYADGSAVLCEGDKACEYEILVEK